MVKNRLRGIVASILVMFIFFTSVLQPAASEKKADSGQDQAYEYIVKEDAYIREGSNAGRNYNYEEITSAHGQQYAGKGYKVINSKYTSGAEIIAIMKFDLPTQQEIDDQQIDTFEFVFNIFKNADPNTGDQTYTFHYTTDTDWKETEITWNNRPSSVNRSSENILFNFNVEKGDAYETKDDAEKRISMDISEKVEELVKEGHTEITVFVTSKNAMNTSLMIHSKETSEEDKPARIIASNRGMDLDGLRKLVEEYTSVNGSSYTADSFKTFTEKLSAAKILVTEENPLIEDIRKAYRELVKAYNELVSASDPNDPDNIAYNRPTRSNLSKTIVDRVTDGDLSTYWSGIFYPAYIDIDLLDTYDLDSVKIYVPEGKVCYYTLYGSNDGKNYDRLYQKRDKSPATSEGDSITFDAETSYRIIRVYMEFTDGDDKAYLSEVKAYGTKKNTNEETLRNGTFEEILNVEAYSDTAYAEPISTNEIYENIYGIIDRTVGPEYRDWFSFEIAPNQENDNDYFELSDKNGKVHIKGNEGLSITTGLNYYYKNYVNVHISEQTMQTKMPAQIAQIGKTVRKETPHKVRYAFNYCTLSYTFAFFGEEEWQKENDWLALNGVNVVLDLAGQEATWIKFLMNFGYSFDDAKDWLTGPAYYAWQFMDNMESFGGPIPDGYVIDRLQLARNSQRWKTSLGMQTILQGYAGMVPTNFSEYQPDVTIIKQGSWNGFSRPDMLATDSDTYIEYSRLFYEAQEFVYGKNSHYYAVDPFHEGGIRPSGLTDDTIAEKVLDSLLEYDDEAVWVVQGWQSNPTNALLKGMGDRREDHVLIVDLIKYPLKSWTKYNKTKYDSTTLDSVEFNGTSWAWGLLANFGGNPSMHGQMQVMVDLILEAKQDSEYMVGLGIISEAQYDNPIIYDLIFDLAWADDDFNLNQWINAYISRRYGGTSDNAKMAWQIMKDSNYDHGVRYTNEVFGTKYSAPQSYSTQNISYGADNLETAFRLLIEDFDRFKNSECYLYDLTEIMRQLTSNYAVLTYNDVLSAKNSNDLEAFKVNKEKFLKAFEVLNEIQSTHQDQLAGEWIGKAQDRAEGYDDFSQDTFELNAKALITSWGSRSGHRSLKDYGWRNYEGMFKDIYTQVWTEYLDKVEANLEFGTSINLITNHNYFNFYWDWIVSKQEYTREAKNSPAEIQDVVNMVLENCMLSGKLDPNAGNLVLNRPVTTNSKNVTGKIDHIADGLEDTKVTIKAEKNGTVIEKPEIIINLIGEFQISKVNVLLDYTQNKYYNYEIYSSVDGITWDKIAEKDSDEIQTEDGDTFKIEDDTARYIKIAVISDSQNLDNPEMTEITINEIRVYGQRVLPTLVQLESLVETVESFDISANDASKIRQLNSAVDLAKAALKEEAPPDEVDAVYWNLYDVFITLDVSGLMNLSLNKPVTAMNDPSGNSYRAVDGDTSTHWDSGRLSTTGQPYEEKITPGWLIVDLEDVYNIEEIRVILGKSNIWHNYEIYASLDQNQWQLIGEKTTKTIPNIAEDYHYLDGVRARYIKLMTTDIQLEGDGRRAGYQVSEFMVLGTPFIEEVDKSELRTLYETNKDMEQGNYTDASWTDFENALTAAKAVIDNPSASRDEVKTAYGNLVLAIAGLKVQAIKTELQSLFDYARTIDTSKIRPALKAELEAAIDKAEDVLNNQSAGQSEVNAASDRLQQAIWNLKDIIDRSDLNDLIELFGKLEEDNYTSDSWAVMKEALDNAKALDDNASQADVEEASQDLQDAFVQLKRKVNKDALENAIKNTEYIRENKDLFIESTMEGLEAIYDRAKAIYESDAATQAEVDNITKELADANARVRVKEDKTALLNAIEEAKTLHAEEYTADSWAVLQLAFSQANQVYNDELATRDQIETATFELEKAILSLKSVDPDESSSDESDDTNDTSDTEDTDDTKDTDDTEDTNDIDDTDDTSDTNDTEDGTGKQSEDDTNQPTDDTKGDQNNAFGKSKVKTGDTGNYGYIIFIACCSLILLGGVSLRSRKEK